MKNVALSTWIRLLKAHNLIIREARTGLSKHCTISQFDVIAHLAREKNGTTLAELSRRLLVTAGNITGLIDRMERTGYVKRLSDPRDRRITRVHLTPAGRQLAEELIPKHARDISDLFTALNQKEKLQLRRLLDKLIQGIENDHAQKF